jgi:hypothetical protein
MKTGPAASTQKAKSENHLSGFIKYIGELSMQGKKSIINVKVLTKSLKRHVILLSNDIEPVFNDI